MHISNQKKSLLLTTFLLVSGGFVIGYWEFSLAGVVIAGAWRGTFAVICMALLLDLAYGAPFGLMHYLYFPLLS
jgi:hypothetical protein